MGDKTGIQWTDASWNPLRGCSRVSEGCRNCYAEKVAARFGGEGLPYEGLTTDRGRWNGTIMLVPEKLDEPLRWQRPRRVFVNSMSDLFHEKVPFDYIAAVFGVMAASPQHTFQVLTKRPERALAFFEWVSSPDRGGVYFDRRPGRGDAFAVLNHCLCVDPVAPVLDRWLDDEWGMDFPVQQWPLPNVWLGVSAEDQATANERIPVLLECPAAVRFVSAEPLLGPIEFTYNRMCIPAGWGPPSRPQQADRRRQLAWVLGEKKISWVIVGGESGPGARPCDVAWIRSIVEQCDAAKVACFVKQLGRVVIESAAYAVVGGVGTGAPEEIIGPGTRTYPPSYFGGKGDAFDEWPEHLRVRQFPETSR